MTLEAVLTLTNSRLLKRLQDVLENEKLSCFIMTKADNCFGILLGLSFVLDHYNAKRVLIYSHEVPECVHLREERI